MSEILHCVGCGSEIIRNDPSDFPAPILRCGDCPPTRCEVCGEMDAMDRRCSCWVALDGMAPADIKAIFAADGTFNVETDGRLSLPEEADRG